MQTDGRFAAVADRHTRLTDTPGAPHFHLAYGVSQLLHVPRELSRERGGVD